MRCERCLRVLEPAEDFSCIESRALCGTCLKKMNAGAIGHFLRDVDGDMRSFVHAYNTMMERREALRKGGGEWRKKSLLRVSLVNGSASQDATQRQMV